MLCFRESKGRMRVEVGGTADLKREREAFAPEEHL